MRRAWFLSAIAAAVLLPPGSHARAAAEPAWVHLHSPDFEVFSSASPAATRETLRHFEFVRGFFEQALGPPPAGRQPVYLVVFGSMQEYARYRPMEWAAASYHQARERDIVVVGDPSEDSFPTAVHEYFHLWAHRQNLRLPLWLNEGLAQLYSTLRPTLGGQVAGEVPAGFARQVARYGWIPLRSVVSASQYPRTGNDPEVTGFYLESWALAHMVELSPDYRGRAPRLLPAIQAGMSSEDALTKIYGKPLSEIEADLQAYLQVIEGRSETYRVKLPKPPKPEAIEPAPEFDRRLILIQLVASRNPAGEVRKELEALAALDPKRPEPHAELGVLAASRGDAATARAEYRNAFDLGGLGAGLLWDYARMLIDNPPEAIPVLDRLLRLDPGRTPARLELARMQLAARQAAAAIGTLAVIHDPAPPDAAAYFQLMARAALAAGRRPEAAAAARDWQRTARDEEELSEAARFLAALDGSPASPPPPRVSIEGRLTAVDCQDGGMTLAVETASGSRSFVLHDSGRAVLSAQGGGLAILACGEQPRPLAVRIEYARPLAANAGVDGVVKRIEFGR